MCTVCYEDPREPDCPAHQARYAPYAPCNPNTTAKSNNPALLLGSLVTSGSMVTPRSVAVHVFVTLCCADTDGSEISLGDLFFLEV